MNISQHAFCPLGFIDNYTYNDSMSLVPSTSYLTSILSPSFGHSYVTFDSQPTYVRFWKPFLKFKGNKFDSIFLTSEFLFARSLSIPFSYHVTFLNF